MRFMSVLFLGMCVAISGWAAGDPGNNRPDEPWFVRVIVQSDEPICEGLKLDVRLLDKSQEPAGRLEIPLEPGGMIDRDWDVDRAPGTSYSFDIELSSCSGLRADHAVLACEVTTLEIGRALYVALRYSKARGELTYVETNAHYESVFEVIEGPTGIEFVNTTDHAVDRCESPGGGSGIRRHYLVEGQWGQFNHRVSFAWPEDVLSVAGGESMNLEGPTGAIIGQHPMAKKVRPEGKRFILFGALDSSQYVVLGSKGDVPASLPWCNKYYVDAEVTDRDPMLELPVKE